MRAAQDLTVAGTSFLVAFSCDSFAFSSDSFAAVSVCI